LISEVGLFALALALMTSLVQAVAPLWGAATGRVRLMQLGDSAAITQLALVAFAFGCLIWAFAVSDFSVRVVATNSYTLKPMFYKISAAWGQHEGSMLLWSLVLAGFGAAVAVFGNNLPATLKARALGVQGIIGVAFLAFIIFTSNPFARLFPAPLEGMGFNPLLQDPGLVIHPPMLYLGYVGFSIAFSFSVAALIEGKVDAAWARWVRPWVLTAWCFLTIGITLGSFWAYYELGWGGWWFWDPVENASFMPWLVGTALLHCVLVVERRHALVNWTLLLSILAFTLSLIGTFLVRSGILTSVHAFAVDPARGVFILFMVLAASGGALTLYALRAKKLEQPPGFAPASREGAILANNFLLLIACGVVFLGTFYPLAIDAISGDKISVGPPYFNLTFGPIMLCVIAAMAFGPMLRWRSDSVKPVGKSLNIPMLIGLGAGLLFGVMGQSLPGGLGIGFGVFLIAAMGRWLQVRIRLGQVTRQQSLVLARAFPRSTWGFIIAHLGFAVAVLGITAMSAWETESLASLRTGQSMTMGEQTFTLDKVQVVKGANYDAQRLTFTVSRNGQPDGEMETERRYYPERDTMTTEAGIRMGFLSNLHITGGEGDGSGAFPVRLTYHPLAMWIWSGAFLMAIGGFVSLSDRRFRVGAPHRVRAGKLAPASA
jgi:cytochrome c-type biogenesis protein CcmF